MWIVSVDLNYYPFIMEFRSYDEAKEYYDNRKRFYDKEKVYLAKVKEVKVL